MKILAVSDLHNVGLLGLDRMVEGCALALVAGDVTVFGRTRGLQQSLHWMQTEFCAWCARHPDTRFCVIGGDHDLFAPRDADRLLWPSNVTWLDDAHPEAEACGLRVFAVGERYDAIPEGVDVLLSHVPPLIEGYNLDVDGRRNRHHGSAELTEAIRRARPKLVVCGHVHGGDRARVVLDGTAVINVSRVRDDRGAKTCRPRVFEADLSSGTAVFRFEEDLEASAAAPAGRSPAGEFRAIARAEKILFKAARSINKHVEKGDFTPNMHYVGQLSDVRTLLRPYRDVYPQVKTYLARLDEIAVSRSEGWRKTIGEVPRFTAGA